MAAIATKRPTSPAQLREAEGIGEAKAGFTDVMNTGTMRNLEG